MSRGRENTSFCGSDSIPSAYTAIGGCMMLQMSLNTAHKFFRGHNPLTDLFLSPHSHLSLPPFSPPTHLLCLCRSLILQFFSRCLNLSLSLSHVLRLVSFLFSHFLLISTSLLKHTHTHTHILYSLYPLFYPPSLLPFFHFSLSFCPILVPHCCPSALKGQCD